MYIVHCTLYIDLSFAKQPGRAEGLGSDAGAGSVFRRPSGLRGKRFPMFSAMRKKMYFCENFEMIVKRDGNQGIVFFDSVLCKIKYLRIRLSQYIPLKQGLRRVSDLLCFL